MHSWQAFIFDFDGVLVDSVEVKTRAFAKLYEAYGNDIVERVVEHHRNNGGMTRFEKFHHYHDKFLGQPLDPEGVSELARAFSAIVVDEVVASSEIPGALEFIKEFNDKLPCIINSATPEDELHEIVLRRDLTPYFRAIYGAPRSKADNLKIILQQYHLNHEQCLFFGDAMSDYQAAAAHKVGFLGILPDENAPLLKKAPGIDWKHNFHEVREWLNSESHSDTGMKLSY